jgi:hypothetical protein
MNKRREKPPVRVEDRLSWARLVPLHRDYGSLGWGLGTVISHGLDPGLERQQFVIACHDRDGFEFQPF